MSMIDVRHEQAAAFAAQSYARSLNFPGVCFGASGPGAINLTTGLANALIDGVPIVGFGGSSPINEYHNGAFQEIDQLVEHFRSAGRPRDAWRIGTEYEMIGLPPSYPGATNATDTRLFPGVAPVTVGASGSRAGTAANDAADAAQPDTHPAVGPRRQPVFLSKLIQSNQRLATVVRIEERRRGQRGTCDGSLQIPGHVKLGGGIRHADAHVARWGEGEA